MKMALVGRGGRGVLGVCRRWASSSEDERRAAKAANKEKEMLRRRRTENESVGVKLGVSRARDTTRQDVSRRTKRSSSAESIRVLGLLPWLNVVWNGSRGRGGGVKGFILSVHQQFTKLLLIFGPIIYFFYDDGKSAFLTRLLVCKQLTETENARVLDVGTGNAELARMMALEVRGSGGSVFCIDLDHANVVAARAKLVDKLGYQNIEVEERDVLDLPGLLEEKGRLADNAFSHTVISMCLHELDPKRRVAILRSASLVTQGGKIVVMDFTPESYGCWNFSQMRNTLFEMLSGHFRYYVAWSQLGGLPALVCCMVVSMLHFLTICLLQPGLIESLKIEHEKNAKGGGFIAFFAEKMLFCYYFCPPFFFCTPSTTRQVETMEERRQMNDLDIPPLSISEVHLEDRDTHACYVVDVGVLAGPEELAPEDKKQAASWFGF